MLYETNVLQLNVAVSEVSRRPFCFLPTALAREVMRSPPSVRLSVYLFPLYLRNRLTVDLELLHVSTEYVTTIARRRLVIGQGRGSG